MHRVLPVPERLPRAARSHMHDKFIGPRYMVYSAAMEMNPLHTADRIRDFPRNRRHRLLQHHQVLHQGVSGRKQDHRQRDHPAEGTRGG